MKRECALESGTAETIVELVNKRLSDGWAISAYAVQDKTHHVILERDIPPKGGGVGFADLPGF